MDWKDIRQVLALPGAADWSAPFRARVQASGRQLVQREASRATIEALTRKLRGRKWVRTHSSKSRIDGRADSRYYRSPNNRKFVVRISNHEHPNVNGYSGAKDYIIDTQMMETRDIAGMIAMIEADEQAFDYHVRRHAKRKRSD